MEKFNPQQTLQELIVHKEGWAVCRVNHENKFAETIDPAVNLAKEKLHDIIDWAADALNNPEFSRAMDAANESGMRKEFIQRFHDRLIGEYERKRGVLKAPSGHADLVGSLMFSHLYKQQAPLIYMHAMRMIDQAQDGVVKMDAEYLKKSVNAQIDRDAKNLEKIKPVMKNTALSAPRGLDVNIIHNSFMETLGAVDPGQSTHKNMTPHDFSSVNMMVDSYNRGVRSILGPDPNQYPPQNREQTRVSKTFEGIFGAISNASNGRKPTNP